MTHDAARSRTAHRSRRAAVLTAVLAALLAALLAACGRPAPPPAAPPAGTPTPAVTASPVPGTAVPGTATPSATASVAPVTTPAPGAGSAADRVAAETVFRDYLRAVASGDFATACALNAPETNQRLLDELARRGTPAASCEQAVAQLYAGSGVAQGAAAIANTLAVTRVDVDGDAATIAWSVEVSGRRPVVTNALRRIDGQWRLLPSPDPAG